MIDKFEDLMYHAGLTAQGCWDEMDSYDHAAIEQYGKLIVNECIKVVHQQDRIPEGFFYPKGAAVHELAIKQHFGIQDE
jgi:hypothetical protein